MSATRTVALLSVATLSLLVPSTGRPQSTPRLTLQDLLAAEPIGETALSPNGKTIALLRSGQVNLMPAEGGWPVALTSTQGAKSGLNWSPDGRELAFASQGSIWTVAVAGGAPRRLTNAPAGGGDPRRAADRAPRWSPDGRWILFESGRNGSGGLFVASADGVTTSFLTMRREEAGDGRWSPDGHQIAYIDREEDAFSGRIKLLHFDGASGRATGEPSTLYTAPEDRGGGWSIHGLSWSPGGQELVAVLQNSGWNHLYLLPAKGGAPKQITDGSSEDDDPVFSCDGSSIAFVSNRVLPEASNVWIVPARGGEPRQAATFSTPGVTGQPQWSPDGKGLYFNRQSPSETSDLVFQSLALQQGPRLLTHTTSQTFAGAAQTPERVTWTSKDGKEIAGMLYTPRDGKPGAKHPAVLWIHGGPEAQDGFHSDGWAQYLAQSGYVVLEPNYRGSTGYGEQFRNLNVEDSNGGEVDDVAAGAQYLIARGLADPARIGIGGGSHGGTMVAYAVTRYPDLFAAALELFGVVDRELFVYRTNRPSAVRWMRKMGGTPADKPDTYRRADILLNVDRIRTPILILHGEDDPQVPPAESASFARALQEHHKAYLYYTYPGELHGFSQPAHRLDAWQKQLAFLDQYLNPKFGTANTSTDPIAVPDAGKLANSHNGPK